ncbi:MAG: carbohydrate kinase [Desulfobulbaceae bacterium]|uniref:Carbohydrate kinase n=1 Tax=Candidatus Desulfobia pelagia TaxID=2841692 RepID=A0A8J6TFZ2_9BACT|nr:carbohydrate kinase [Candidatus Desulfobia pelagia]
MIISIGEIVWDIFGDTKILGGAPLNVAYHLAQLDRQIKLVSRIGTDDLASSTLHQISSLGLPVEDIQQDDTLPTGQVVVTVGENNEPSFDIIAPAAWDAIETSTFEGREAQKYHMVFGTLAQRSEKTRETIRSLWPGADILFYDVNLRPPFTPPERVLNSLIAADVVKLNDNELHEVTDWLQLSSGDLKERAQALFSHYKLLALVVTMGKSGAFVVTRNCLVEHPGFPVEVIDTVGAGDAFFAAFIDSMLKKKNWHTCLELANQRGAYVAGCQGATPPMKSFKPQL